ncbi:bifunctional glutamate N-acetyltransferase/amino-acid acetyltransferase ArgJ [Victivallis vadensis]|uniref:Arginine biosynthesis bifunctional protein ArgJ n=1 Tax=Victivallis vadensis TaxID=172901 RepID=A0A2U1BA42_9BACT|nr:bifunctional glutamate N-acetyltransferase/amino-acid acetyltransferase ArgJ [Victivallis vadensis]NMD87654.1 bifunctional glutamate N-acetyltransferase/amino-acid acetyltransferase ArgJ [Victivallis vadensis]PVY45538.1 glutamate N-acetyltransferase [Victivallis vadensis]HJH05029.1 bifunctional glutamate N-acetyltransferase/amino-acid acetyltransferase ArgJ [Victivallis vadensis]
MSKFNWIDGGSVTSVPGFRAAGVTAGFKRSGAPDFAMIASDVPANFAGAFTSCTFAAAPVQVCRKRVLESEYLRAAAINSGNANACTGATGIANAERTCELVAVRLGVKPEEVAVSSTGRIGVQMPMATIERGIDLAAAALSDKGGPTAAEAIMTTDTVPKSVALQLEIGGKTVTIGAMTKGAGMIDPAMTVPHATMLCYITTDVKADNALLRDMIGANVADSFNRITVDGDMSTNDTTIVMANGLSGIELKAGTPEAALFQEALLTVMQDLARRMVMDGEGATKFVTVKVVHSRSKENAKLCAEAVANSLLCKTAWFGGDPNWGRVVAALGYSGATFDPDKTDIYYDGMPVVRQGGDAGTPESALCGIVKQREFTVLVDQNEGDAEYWVWTSDISYEYVKINADYHT